MIGIIFSRDRVMQLDATLRSLMSHCQDWEKINLNIIYLASNDYYKHQYDLLRKSFFRFNNIKFMVQNHFELDMISILLPNNYYPRFRIFQYLKYKLRIFPEFSRMSDKRNEAGGFVLFLVDDNIFVNKFSLECVEKTLINNPQAVGFSLRLGTNIKQNYTNNILTIIPKYEIVEQDIIRFNWTEATSDFGYPLEISSSVYWVSDIQNIIYHIPFRNPNELERRMATTAAYSRQLRNDYPFLLCFYESVTFCNPINKVQTVNKNRSWDRPDYSTLALADLYEKGFRIDTDALNGFTPYSCHQEVDLNFKQINK